MGAKEVKLKAAANGVCACCYTRFDENSLCISTGPTPATNRVYVVCTNKQCPLFGKQAAPSLPMHQVMKNYTGPVEVQMIEGKLCVGALA